MATGLFNLKQVNQAIRQGGWPNPSSISTYGAYFGGSGSGQYLTGPTTSALNFSTGSFTVEFWAFLSAYGGGDLTIMFSASNASADFQFGASASNGVYWHNSGNQLTSNATAVPLGKWVHMALVRSGTTASLFCNGIRYSTTTNSAAVNLTNFNIGSYQGAPTAYMTKGWISNLRITNTAVYDPTATTLTLPLTNLTAISGTQLLTLQNATIIDNSTNALTITNNGSVAMQTVAPFGLSNYKTSAVEYLVVAGGGSGGSSNGGGGGAGGLLTGIVTVAAGTSYTVTVGGGGALVNGNLAGNSGVASVFGSISATGGGGGGGYSDSGLSGGSGGGSGGNVGDASKNGQGTVGQGNAGALVLYAVGGGGGGGGAGTVASVAQGGAGIASVISGTVTAYAGGGGSRSGATGGAGGVGGGGAGAGDSGTPVAGTTNTGGGGGGARGSQNSGAGGSGIVILSYPDTYAAASAVTGATVSTSGSGSVNFATAGYFSTGTGTAPSQSGDFTLEGWFNLSTFNQSGGYALLGGTTSGANYFGFKSTNIVINSATTSTEKLIACTLPSTNTWFHYCLMRSGSTLYAFLNGSLQGSSTWTDVLFSSGSLLVGGYGSATYICPGYMSNLRLTNTAVYSTSGFTVSTTPLTKITGTALLMNTASGAYAADATGTWSFLNLYTAPTWNASSPFTVTGYKNRVYTWTSSGSITF